jgi:hypothetical protein
LFCFEKVERGWWSSERLERMVEERQRGLVELETVYQRLNGRSVKRGVGSQGKWVEKVLLMEMTCSWYWRDQLINLRRLVPSSQL